MFNLKQCIGKIIKKKRKEDDNVIYRHVSKSSEEEFKKKSEELFNLYGHEFHLKLSQIIEDDEYKIIY